jgi:hypothetical protein
MNFASILLALTATSLTTPCSDAKLLTIQTETYVKKYKDDKTKLDPVQNTLNTNSSLALANVTTADGTVVQFIEPEEGFILVVGTELANEPIAVENVDATKLQAKSTTQTAKTIQATSSSSLSTSSYSDPVAMYEAFSGTSAPQKLRDANERRKSYIASRRPLPSQPQTEKQTTQSTTSSSRLRGGGGDGADRNLRTCTDWWETEWCNHQVADPDSSSCTCFTCKTGTRVEYIVSESIYMNAHSARGTISQSIEYLSCSADEEDDVGQQQPCAWRALDVQHVSEGEIKYVQGFGNGDLIQWSATLTGEYSGWDWYVSFRSRNRNLFCVFL